ncbi:hypothetical protein L1887_23814 [Cichorium endivia]|nr:hypothetical protein L1887_23814 [Cichorium endivia]
MPYNPGGHWVLAVLDMQTTTCYYVDSVRPTDVHADLKHMIEAALSLYAVQSGSKKRVNIKWINVLCPLQPGDTECGYYVLKFMKAVVDEGLQVLNNNFWGKNEYTNAELDDLREESATYATTFIYQ